MGCHCLLHLKRQRNQIANTCWITEKVREFQKNIYFCFVDYTKVFDYVDHNGLWKILKEILPILGKTCMQVKKEQSELDMEQWTHSKSGKEYVKSIYCQLAYLTCM